MFCCRDQFIWESVSCIIADKTTSFECVTRKTKVGAVQCVKYCGGLFVVVVVVVEVHRKIGGTGKDVGLLYWQVATRLGKRENTKFAPRTDAEI